MDTVDVDPLIGRTLGAYVIKSRLGEGGMGVVYIAEHQTIGRRAAVKVLKPEAQADAEWKKRFLSEAKALASLKHRNVVEIFDFGETPDHYEYLMMEWLEGTPLTEYLQELDAKGQLPLAPAVALGFAEQILNGLGEAHKKGVVHRDLKPANVMRIREHNGEALLKLVDFGLAKQDPSLFTGGPRDVQSSLRAGTPEYVAPEQAQGLTADGRADLYSLGVMLYEMLSGQLPFKSNSVAELVQMQVFSEPPPLGSKVANLPEGIEPFVHRLLLKRPEDRPESADVARQTVQRLLKQIARDATAVRSVAIPGSAEPSSKTAPTQKIERPLPLNTDDALAAAIPPGRSRPVLLAGAALLLLGVAGIGWWWLGDEPQARPAAPRQDPVTPQARLLAPLPVVEPVPVEPPMDASVATVEPAVVQPVEPPKVEPVKVAPVKVAVAASSRKVVADAGAALPLADGRSNSSRCANEGWRAEELERADKIEAAVRRNGGGGDAEASLNIVREKIKRAKSDAECEAAADALGKWAEDHGL